jgi:hypothetical protein
MVGPPVTYANAEVRGRLRAWKQKLARDYAVFERAYEAPNGDLRDAAVDMVKRDSLVGRQRAFAKIQRAIGPGVTLELAHLDGKHPHAVFSLFRPRADRALGRAVERSRFLHPGAIIREAHLNLLALPASVITRPSFGDPADRGELVKADPAPSSPR